MKSIDEIHEELGSLSFTNLGELHYNLNTPELYEHATNFEEGVISSHGALIVDTGEFTGRSADDKFAVETAANTDEIWWNKFTQKFSPENFTALKYRLAAYLQGRELYVRDCFVGADETYRIPCRIISEYAWHSMFARNMFIEATDEELDTFLPGFTVISAPHFEVSPKIDGSRSKVCIVLNFDEKLAIIAGTQYSGEIKKSMFTLMNYLLPKKGVFPMHCSANIGDNGEVALFFGLSGTGKTTLSADPERQLIGDDEHGWSENGIFNFEGGCYAKIINLSAESEPMIYRMTRTFGTIIENTVFDPETRELDLFDDSITENTRASYPRSSLDNIASENKGGHPKNVFFLTADAFGVMPPISKLTPEQAMFHFLSGYTAKLAGTEVGVKEPKPNFSTCFGAPFMVHHPAVYAELLKEKINEHGVQVWLVNTGWSGGAYGVGKRMKIEYTRALLHSALGGDLTNVEFEKEPFFNLSIPKSCHGVPSEILNPRNTWSDKAAYDAQAKSLAEQFLKNIEKHSKGLDQAVIDSVKP